MQNQIEAPVGWFDLLLISFKKSCVLMIFCVLRWKLICYKKLSVYTIFLQRYKIWETWQKNILTFPRLSISTSAASNDWKPTSLSLCDSLCWTGTSPSNMPGCSPELSVRLLLSLVYKMSIISRTAPWTCQICSRLIPSTSGKWLIFNIFLEIMSLLSGWKVTKWHYDKMALWHLCVRNMLYI